MQIKGEAKLLRIFIGESDKIGSVPVYEKFVITTRKSGLAGATLFKGIMGYGNKSHINTAKILRLSQDLALIIEIVYESNKIEHLLPAVDEIFETSVAVA